MPKLIAVLSMIVALLLPQGAGSANLEANKRVVLEFYDLALNRHVHSIRELGQRGVAIVDIFRLENGKIVQHWDVVQAILENPANSNGLF